MLTSASSFGRGVVSIKDASPGDILFTDESLLFGQDIESYKIDPRCLFCTKSAPCFIHVENTNELLEYLKIEAVDDDPRGRIAAALLSATTEFSKAIQTFLVPYSSKYTDFADHNFALLAKLTNLFPQKAEVVNSVLGMLRSVCVTVNACSLREAPIHVTSNELKCMWLSLGEVPTFEDLLVHRELPPIIGVALCALASHVNHTCLNPNAEFRWELDKENDKLRLEAIALSDVACGEEIFVCYYSNDDDVSAGNNCSTRTILEKHFGFSCECAACVMKKKL